MRWNGILLALGLATILSSGCTMTQQIADTGFKPPSGNYKLIVMQPDISVGLLTAGGVVEPNQEWTEQARKNVLDAIVSQQANRGGDTKVARTREEAGGDPAAVADLVNLHNAVGTSIKLHKYLGVALPTKKDRFDWTLGEDAVKFGSATGYDYALFLHAEDSFSSGGRAALQVAGLLACAVGACVMPTGGQQVAFATLVDLKSGQVVWFNFLASAVGDIRTPDGATKMVGALLDKMKAGKEAKTKS